jgi:ribosomal protein S3
MSKTFALGFIPLNKFHKNIDYILTEVRLKYGISGVKVWVYRSNNLKNN